MSELSEAIAVMQRYESNGNTASTGDAEATINAALILSHRYLDLLVDPSKLIKPLKWEADKQNWLANTVFGEYYIDLEEGWVISPEGDTLPCDSAEHGKALCWEHYCDRLKPVFDIPQA